MNLGPLMPLTFFEAVPAAVGVIGKDELLIHRFLHPARAARSGNRSRRYAGVFADLKGPGDRVVRSR